MNAGYYQTPLSHFIERVQPEHGASGGASSCPRSHPHSHLLSDPGPANLFLSNCVWRRAVCWHVGNTALRAVASQSSLWRSQFLYETGPGFASLNKRFLVDSDRRDNLQLIYKLIGTTIHSCEYSATSCYITTAVPSRSQIRLVVQCTHNQLSRSRIRD